MTETQKLIKQVFNDYEYDDEHFITTPHIENLEKILLQKVAEMQANLVYAVAMPTLDNELQIIYKEGKPHGIRDKCGYLLFFTEILKYDGQMGRYRKEIDNQKKLAEYLLDKLSKCPV